MKLKALATALLAVTIAASAHAATGAVGAGAGLSIPVGDLSDGAGIGFHFGGTYTYMVNEQLGVGGDLGYHLLGEKDVTIGSNSISSKLSLVQYGAHGKYVLPTQSDVHPFLKVGLGLYSAKAEVESNVVGVSGSSDTETEFGFNFGGGVDWKINDSMNWGVTAAYHYIGSDPAGTLITLGAGLSWGIGN